MRETASGSEAARRRRIARIRDSILWSVWRACAALSRSRNFVRSAEGRKKQGGDDAGQHRSHENAEPDLFQHHLVVEGQRADEEAHGEADAGQEGHGVEL